MKSFYNYFIEKECNIFIPALQRDYVQGARNEIISTFIYDIYTALSNDKGFLELNYIYGYNCENKGFVAIDGQQRLITLWLVYLYLEIERKNSYFPKLLFESREFANNFAEELSYQVLQHNPQNIEELVSDKLKLNEVSWFIPSWYEDITVKNMINTWEQIKSTFTNTIPSDNYNNIAFSFLDLLKETNNQIIKDDIYIKMNGRGKPLTYFDNLKAYLDDKLSKMVVDGEIDEEFLRDWRYKIDNEWIDFIWSNRNKKQINHQNIDDEQTRLFYNLLLIYWLKGDELQKHIEYLLNSESHKIYKENIASYLKIEGDSSLIAKKLSEKIFEELKKIDNTIPITWIDLLDLFNKDVLIFIKSSLNNFVVESADNNIDIISIINNINPGNSSSNDSKSIKLFDKEDDKKTNFYLIAMQNKFSYINLLYLYAIIKFSKENCSEANFIRYVRIIRNIVVNLENINSVNITDIFKTIDYIADKVNLLSQSSDGKSFYETLLNLQESIKSIKNIKIIRGLDSQIKEEVEKIQFLSDKFEKDNEDYEITIFDSENSLFLHGKIAFLYHKKNGDDGLDWDNFMQKYKNFLKYFKYEDGQLTDDYKYQLLKAFILIGKFEKDTNTVLSDKISTWYRLLITPFNYSIFHKILTTDDLDSLIVTNFQYFEQQNDWCQLIGNLLHNDFFLHFILNHNRLKESMKRHNRLQPCGRYKGWISLNHQHRDEVLYDAAIKNLNADGKSVIFTMNENNNNAVKIKKINSEISYKYKFFIYQWDNYVVISLKGNKYLWNDNNKIYIFNKETKKWDAISEDEFKANMGISEKKE